MTDPSTSTEESAKAAPPGESGTEKRKGPIRRLYDWVLHWADTPYGEPALGLISAAESSFFPLPPDPLLVALCLGAPKRSFRFAAVCTITSVIGGIIGYGIGALGWDLMGGFFFEYVPGVTPEAFDGVQAFFVKWEFWAVLCCRTPAWQIFFLFYCIFGPFFFASPQFFFGF